MTTTVNARSSDALFRNLTDLTRAFGNAQNAMRARIQQVKSGKFAIPRKTRRLSVQELTTLRDRARDELRTFLSEMTDDERNMVAISLGNRDWEERINEMMDPAKDPHL